MSDDNALAAEMPDEQPIDLPAQSSPSPQWIVEVFTGLGKVLNYVGIAGFIVISAVVFIYFFTTVAQRAEFFNDWFLFKSGNSQFFIVVLVLIIFLITQQIHYKRVISMKEDRIKELAGKKSSKYAQELNIKLSSSIKRKK